MTGVSPRFEFTVTKRLVLRVQPGEDSRGPAEPGVLLVLCRRVAAGKGVAALCPTRVRFFLPATVAEKVAAAIVDVVTWLRRPKAAVRSTFRRDRRPNHRQRPVERDLWAPPPSQQGELPVGPAETRCG